jgi:DNA-directed RNA polymerase
MTFPRRQRDVERHIPSIDRQTYGPYLALLDADVLAVITLHEVRAPRQPATLHNICNYLRYSPIYIKTIPDIIIHTRP